MKVVIVGGGVAGLALARSLVRRGLAPQVLERAPAGTPAVARPFMPSYHGFDALEDAGVLDGLRAIAAPIAPREDGTPVALAATFARVVALLAEGVRVAHGQEVVGLVRDGERVAGVRVRDEGGERDRPADLVVACDGVRSPLRAMAGIDAPVTLADGAHLSFISPVRVEPAFTMRYQADGRQIGLLGWPDGSAGWWDIDRCGRDAALAPGLDAFRAAFTRLIPAAAPAVEALSSVDALVYREVPEVRSPVWWVPGLVLIGDAAHAVGPETGLGAGLGLGDALALAVAIERNPGDADAACADYERWRRPAVEPYLEVGAAGARMPRRGERPPEERWPPVA